MMATARTTQSKPKNNNTVKNMVQNTNYKPNGYSSNTTAAPGHNKNVSVRARALSDDPTPKSGEDETLETSGDNDVALDGAKPSSNNIMDEVFQIDEPQAFRMPAVDETSSEPAQLDNVSFIDLSQGIFLIGNMLGHCPITPRIIATTCNIAARHVDDRLNRFAEIYPKIDVESDFGVSAYSKLSSIRLLLRAMRAYVCWAAFTTDIVSGALIHIASEIHDWALTYEDPFDDVTAEADDAGAHST